MKINLGEDLDGHRAQSDGDSEQVRTHTAALSGCRVPGPQRQRHQRRQRRGEHDSPEPVAVAAQAIQRFHPRVEWQRIRDGGKDVRDKQHRAQQEAHAEGVAAEAIDAAEIPLATGYFCARTARKTPRGMPRAAERPARRMLFRL